MNSKNLVMSSEISSEEISDDHDHQNEAVQDHDTATGTKRSYECTFCKRGFTNAQALGGHMNIHRKDRAKAKHDTPNSSLQNKFTNDESIALPFFSSEISNQPIRHYSILEPQENCDMHFRSPPAPNLRNQPQPQPAPAHAFQYEFHNQRSHSHSLSHLMYLNQELPGANLSLRIGPSDVDNTHQVIIRRGTQNDNNEVDLELRLGHAP